MGTLGNIYVVSPGCTGLSGYGIKLMVWIAAVTFVWSSRDNCVCLPYCLFNQFLVHSWSGNNINNNVGVVVGKKCRTSQPKCDVHM